MPERIGVVTICFNLRLHGMPVGVAYWVIQKGLGLSLF